MSEEYTPSGGPPGLVAEALSPVQPDSREDKLTSGIALRLSGGGVARNFVEAFVEPTCPPLPHLRNAAARQ